MKLATSACALALLICAIPQSLAIAGDVGDTSRYCVNPVPHVAAPPKIDGIVGKREWSAASRLPGLIHAQNGTVCDTRSRVYVCYDDQTLYIAFQIDRAENARLPRANQTAHDGDFDQDDVIEVLLDPAHAHQTTFSFGGNAASAFWDRADDNAWNPAWQFKSRLDENFGWEGELAIPFQSLGRAAPKTGEVWGFDFLNRQRSPVDETSGYSFSAKPNRAADLSHLVFVRDTPPVRFLQSGPFTDNETGGGAIVELANFAEGKPSALSVAVELLKRKSDARGSFFPAITGAYTETADIIVDSPKQMIAQELAKYEPVSTPAAHISSDMTIAANRRAEARAIESAPGEYLLRYRIANGDQIISAGLLPYVLAPPIRMTLTPYFLSPGVIDARVDMRNAKEWGKGAKAKFSLAKKAGAAPLAQADRDFTGAREFAVALPTTSLDAGGYLVTMDLIGADGKTIGSQSAGITKPATPDWITHRVGLTPEVPLPWKPIEANGQRVSFLMGEYQLADLGLPAQVNVRTIYDEKRTPILNKPITFKGTVDGAPLAVSQSQSKITNQRPGVVEFESRSISGTLAIEARTAFEYDGMAKVTLKLAPVGTQPAAINDLCLEFPLAEEFSTLFLRAPSPTPTTTKGIFSAGVVPANGIQQEFTFSMWLGNEERGFRWFSENQKGWHVGEKFRDQTIEIVPTDHGRVLRINLVKDEKPLMLSSPREIVFGYMFTPARSIRVKGINHGLVHDRMPRTVGSHMNNGESWFFPLQGWPIIGGERLKQVAVAQQAKEWGVHTLEQMRALVQGGHQYGVTVTPYSGWFLPSESDEHKVFGDEMTADPLRGAGCGCNILCWNTSVQDAYIALLKDRIGDVGIDGFRLDAGFSVENCQDLNHAGYGSACGYVDDDGKLQSSRAIFAARKAAQRAYRVFHGSEKSDSVLLQHVHQGNRYDPILDNMDGVVSAEGGETKAKTLKEFPLDFYRASIMGDQHGWQVIYMAKAPLIGFDARLGMCLLHNFSPRGTHMLVDANEHSYGRNSHSPTPIWAARDWIGPFEKGTEFWGYWKNEKLLSTGDPNVKGSFHVRRGEKLLLGVVNLERKPVLANVHLDLPTLGFSGKVYAYDPQNRAEVSIDGGTMPLAIAAESYRMILISAKPLNVFVPETIGENLVPEIAPDKWPADGSVPAGWNPRWYVDSRTPRPPAPAELRVENGTITFVGDGQSAIRMSKALKVEKGKSYLLEAEAQIDCDDGAFAGPDIDGCYFQIGLGDTSRYLSDRRSLTSQSPAGRDEKVRLWFTVKEQANVELWLNRVKGKAIVRKLTVHELKNTPRAPWEIEG